MTDTTKSEDKPIDDGDWLGYGVYAETLWVRIERALDKDDLGDDPLVIGLFGEWGAGKSYLLDLIEKHARKEADVRIGWRKQDGGAEGYVLTIPVNFQPWKYEHEKHLLIPMLLHILQALEKDIKTGQTWAEAAGDAIPAAVKKHIELFVSAFAVLLSGAAYALEGTVPMSSRVGLAVAGFAAKWVGKESSPDDKSKSVDIEHLDNGRTYYEIHETLKGITRPNKFGKSVGITIHEDIQVNFVVFIDDLDRCLPEKAVQTLEMIKTIFNVDSFAFVLALDEEVIERGIGHRYRDYNFEGKKPEMPITGFEYLEKIVHLPFRLPAITVTQALSLMTEYEKKVIEKPNSTPRSNYVKEAWMLNRQFRETFPVTVRGKNQEIERTNYKINLAHMAVNCFEVYVPRKLIRIVELFHQVLEVLHARGRLDLVGVDKVIDPRLLMAFVLLQLFHPDLYRACKRSSSGFEALLEGFSAPEPALVDARPAAEALTDRTSDMDLLHWAVGWWGLKPPLNVKSAKWRVSNEVDNKTDRNDALRIKLPLIERILEHRSAERHAFDPMRLFAQLRVLKSENVNFDSRLYVALLTLGKDDAMPSRSELTVFEQLVTGEISTTQAQSTNGSGEVSAPVVVAGAIVSSFIQEEDVRVLYTALVSSVEAERRRTTEIAKLSPGESLTVDVADSLLRLTTYELNRVADKEKTLQQQRLLAGLQHLAPHLPKDATKLKDWWALIEPLGKDITFETKVENLKSLQTKVQLLNIKELLAQDNRFDPQNLYFPTQNWHVNTSDQEPIPGFVRVITKNEVFKPFNDQMGVELKPYLMARYLTTVGQFASFVNDTEGETPNNWAEQSVFTNLPVTYVSWHDAQAYVGWLNQQPTFLDKLKNTGLEGYKAALPNEWQWERAARAKDFDAYDDRDFPWGGIDSKTAPLHANIHGSKIGSPSVVGLFEPNPLGIFDLSGNVWEWQNNQYSDKNKHMTLRGGSWAGLSDGARCSYRYWFPPKDWYGYVGFRLVLSLADS